MTCAQHTYIHCRCWKSICHIFSYTGRNKRRRYADFMIMGGPDVYKVLKKSCIVSNSIQSVGHPLTLHENFLMAFPLIFSSLLHFALLIATLFVPFLPLPPIFLLFYFPLLFSLDLFLPSFFSTYNP